MTDNIITISTQDKTSAKITVSSSGTDGKVNVTADTAEYWSRKSREWAISDEIVDREDYSSKYYAKKSKESAEQAKQEADRAVEEVKQGLIDISQSKDDALGSIQRERDKSILDIEEAKDNAKEDLTNGLDEAKQNAIDEIGKAGTEKLEDINDVLDKAEKAIDELEQEGNKQVQRVIDEGDTQVARVKSTGFYMEGDKLYYIDKETGEIKEFKSGGDIDLDKVNQSKALETGNVSADPDVLAEIIKYKESAVESGVDNIDGIEIPYVKSKTGSKIVDAKYRDRVRQVYEQEGYAPYYTLQEGGLNKDLIIGNPAINGNEVSGFSLNDGLQAKFKPTTKGCIIEGAFKYEKRWTDEQRLLWLEWTEPEYYKAIFVLMADGNDVSYYIEYPDGSDSGSTFVTVSDEDIIHFKIRVEQSEIIFDVNGKTKTEWAEYSGSKEISLTIGSFDNYAPVNCTFLLDSLKITDLNGESIYDVFLEPNFTLPMGEIYGMIERKSSILEGDTPYYFGKSEYSTIAPNKVGMLISLGQENSKRDYPSYYDWLLERRNEQLIQLYGFVTSNNLIYFLRSETPKVGDIVYGYIPLATAAGTVTSLNGNGFTFSGTSVVSGGNITNLTCVPDSTKNVKSIIVKNGYTNDSSVDYSPKVLLKSEVDTRTWYTNDYDFIINEENETFRLPLKNGEEILPSSKRISLSSYVKSDTTVFPSAPANGWVQFNGNGTPVVAYLRNMNSETFISKGQSSSEMYSRYNINAKRGDKVLFYINNAQNAEVDFIYAQGNGNLYYYVGDTVQNRGLINVGAMTETLATKTDVSLSNINSDAKNLIAHMGMPSSRYVDFALGADGTEYTALADGYFVFGKRATAVGQFFNVTYVRPLFCPFWSDVGSGAVGNILGHLVPVQKGQVIRISYNAGGEVTVSRFIYAEGAQ